MSQPRREVRPTSATNCARSSPAPDLGALHRPHGSHQLPRHLHNSARAYFDFAVPGDRTAAYQLVLLQAADVADQEQ